MKTKEQIQEPTLDIVSKDQENSSELLKFEHIENTPFTIVTQGEENYGLIGNHRITDMYTNKEELKKDIQKITWDRITQVIWSVVEKYKEINKEN